MGALTDKRAKLAAKHGYTPYPCSPEDKAGIARNVRSGQLPINGLRIQPVDDTNGWYIWAGETMSKADDFFVPLHASHLEEWCPLVLPYLELPPGWRFLITPNYEDVWFDEELETRPG